MSNENGNRMSSDLYRGRFCSDGVHLTMGTGLVRVLVDGVDVSAIYAIKFITFNSNGPDQFEAYDIEEGRKNLGKPRILRTYEGNVVVEPV